MNTGAYTRRQIGPNEVWPNRLNRCSVLDLAGSAPTYKGYDNLYGFSYNTKNYPAQSWDDSLISTTK